MNILISTLMFNGYTGSEWYNYELCKGLAEMIDEKGKKLNKVTLLSNINPCSSLNSKLQKLGVKVLDFKKINALPRNFDVIHYSHKPVGELLLRFFPSNKFITTIHSEIIDLEHPVIDSRILRYISIRPSIRTMLETKFKVPSHQISDVWNPIDDTRFNLDGVTDERFVLFHGSLDYLRRNAALDCIEKSKNEGLKTLFVGRNDYPNVFNSVNMPTCEFITAKSDISDLVKRCTYTAGILLGRSTIEGYFCGKKGLIYNVDNQGNILSSSYTMQNTLDKFKTKNVVDQIYGVYHECI